MTQACSEPRRSLGERTSPLPRPLEVRIPGFPFNHKMSILTPRSRCRSTITPMRGDRRCVRGSQRVYAYPNTPRFLPQAALEKIVYRREGAQGVRNVASCQLRS